MVLTTSNYRISNPNANQIKVVMNASRCSKKRYCITYTDDIAVYKLECFGSMDKARSVKAKMLEAIKKDKDFKLYE